MCEKNLKKKLKEEVEDLMEVHEDSDLPIIEKRTKQKKFLE